jgi:hypothetical protein
MQEEWAQSIRDQCQEAEVAFFFKQWGGRTPKAAGRLLDGKIWDEMPDVLDRHLTKCKQHTLEPHRKSNDVGVTTLLEM